MPLTDRDPKENFQEDYPSGCRIDPEFVIDQRTIDAVKEFKRRMHGLLKPTQGRVDEKTIHYRWLLKALSEIYGISEPKLVVGFTRENPRPGSSYYPVSSRYNIRTHTITLYGKFSIVTFLHEFCHARGYGEEFAVIYSNSLWAKVFPNSVRNICHQEGIHTVTLSENRRNTHHKSGWFKENKRHRIVYYKSKRKRIKNG